jgi:hypothetical protein
MDSNVNTDANSVPAFLRCYKSPSYSRNSPKVHYRTHKGPPVVTILRQINPLHTLQSHLFNIHFNITLHLCLYFKPISFFQVSLPKRYSNFAPSQCVPHALPISPSFFISVVVSGEWCKSWCSSLCSFLQPAVISFPLVHGSFSTPYSRIPSAYFPRLVWQTKCHTHTKQQEYLRFCVFYAANNKRKYSGLNGSRHFTNLNPF